MKPNSRAAAFTLALVLCASLPAVAELPSLSTAAWLGFFAGQTTSGCALGVTTKGQIIFNPIKGAEVPTGGWSFHLRPIVEEILPDGKVVVRDLDPETLESAQQAADKIEKVVYTGKVQGGAKLEVTVEQSRGIFLVGGRVVDPGPGENRMRVAIVGRTPRFYGSYSEGAKATTDEDKAQKEKREKALEKRVEDERLDLKLLNRKTVKQPILEPADLASAEISGVGISEMGMDFQMFRGGKLSLVASPNSAFTLKLKKGARIFKNEFWINWRTDPEKDPEGKARMAIRTN
jgi:hypothetical protein